MAASGHIAFGGLAGGDVYDGSEEVGFPMLTTEILEQKRGVVSLEAFGTYWEEMGLWSTEEEVWGRGGVGEERRTLDMISSWLLKCALQFLQP